MMLNVATCQFPVGPNVKKNAAYIIRQIETSAASGADVAHFCEGALSGYAGADFPSFENFDWKALRDSTATIAKAAGEFGVWVLLGSSHELSEGRKPHNCVYVIDDQGMIVDRYDKRFCSGDLQSKSGDLSHYTPGDYSCVFEVRGLKCGVLICYDYRFPELYRDYKRNGVDVLFHSFHAGNINPKLLQEMQSQVGPE
ncbi:MAG: carbon-nitrogen hydrolase family protein, partial [Rhodothermales bacterium]|nr:carbon-nitrogen hydrolase family protein [Rhodothermales bacterium]